MPEQNVENLEVLKLLRSTFSSNLVKNGKEKGLTNGTLCHEVRSCQM